MRRLCKYISVKIKMWKISYVISHMYSKIEKENGKGTIETVNAFKKAVKIYYLQNHYSIEILRKRYATLSFKIKYSVNVPYDMCVGLMSGVAATLLMGDKRRYIINIVFVTLFFCYVYFVNIKLTQRSFEKELLSNKSKIERNEIIRLLKYKYDIVVGEDM